MPLQETPPRQTDYQPILYIRLSPNQDWLGLGRRWRDDPELEGIITVAVQIASVLLRALSWSGVE